MFPMSAGYRKETQSEVNPHDNDPFSVFSFKVNLGTSLLNLILPSRSSGIKLNAQVMQ